MKSIIEWNKVEDELPDEDMAVLMAVECDYGQYEKACYEVMPGVLEDGRWCYLDRLEVSDRSRVTHWADFPEFDPDSDKGQKDGEVLNDGRETELVKTGEWSEDN